MKNLFVVLFALSISFSLSAQPDSVVIKKISDEIFTSGHCYKNEEYLCKKIGARLSGSDNAEKAVQWTFDLMKSYGFDTVYLQEVMVPHWVRGEKEIAKAENENLDIVALGGSVATPKEGITAEVIEVKNFDKLKKLVKEKVADKMVF